MRTPFETLKVSVTVPSAPAAVDPSSAAPDEDEPDAESDADDDADDESDESEGEEPAVQAPTTTRISAAEVLERARMG
jgi:hypothetical protein